MATFANYDITQLLIFVRFLKSKKISGKLDFALIDTSFAFDRVSRKIDARRWPLIT